MSTTHYTVDQHIIHVSKPGGRVTDHDGTLLMAVKQYTPKLPRHGNGITIVAAQANACPKEVYEPLWDAIFQASAGFNVNISGIWIADITPQGESGDLNQDKDFDDDDFSLTHHSQHLSALMHHFKDDMKDPIFAFGHSMGGIHMVQLSISHPHLFAGIILVDPMIRQRQSVERTLKAVKAVAARRQRWSNLEEARADLLRSPVYGEWDTTAFERYVEYGLRRRPDDGEKIPCDRTEVMLRTPVHQEILAMVRPGFMDIEGIPSSVLLRPEPCICYDMLRDLRPKVLYILGGRSGLERNYAGMAERTGLRVGCSGGPATEIVLKEVGHYAPMEAPTKVSEVVVHWLSRMSTGSTKALKL